jgi:hypothetical protein
MARKKPEWFKDLRLPSLAIMHLTRRPDLRVEQENRMGSKVLDLIVEIVDGEGPAWKRFGVYLQGTMSPVTIEHANKVLNISLRRFFDDFGEPTLPFCLFYFTVAEGQGFVTWIAEPLVKDGLSTLKYHEKADFIVLDQEALDHIVDQVNNYFEAIRSQAIRT